MSEPALIELQNISLNRGVTRVFDNLSLRVEQAANTVILGPNGAGKSSLIKLLLRDIHPLHNPASGFSILGDTQADVWTLRQQFGLVSHELQNRFDGTETGLQVVVSGFFSSIGTWAHQEYDRGQIARAREVMAQLGAEGLADLPYGRLSTGQQRRLLLARALVHDPAYLIMDEPTSGLDPEATFHYLDRVGELLGRGKHLVLVTHHIHEIPPEIDRVIMLKEGAVFAEGPKRELLTSERLSQLYNYPLRLVESGRYYQVFPG